MTTKRPAPSETGGVYYGPLAVGLVERLHDDLERHVFLRALHDTNTILFYAFVETHLDEMLPVLYTPTVDEGRSLPGVQPYLSATARSVPELPDRDRITAQLDAIDGDIDVVVVTDGERILGLGDLGIGGMASKRKVKSPTARRSPSRSPWSYAVCRPMRDPSPDDIAIAPPNQAHASCCARSPPARGCGPTRRFQWDSDGYVERFCPLEDILGEDAEGPFGFGICPFEHLDALPDSPCELGESLRESSHRISSGKRSRRKGIKQQVLIDGVDAPIGCYTQFAQPCRHGV